MTLLDVDTAGPQQNERMEGRQEAEVRVPATSVQDGDLGQAGAWQRRQPLYLLFLVLALVAFVGGPLAAAMAAGGLLLPWSISSLLALIVGLLGLAVGEGATKR